MVVGQPFPKDGDRKGAFSSRHTLGPPPAPCRRPVLYFWMRAVQCNPYVCSHGRWAAYRNAGSSVHACLLPACLLGPPPNPPACLQPAFLPAWLPLTASLSLSLFLLSCRPASGHLCGLGLAALEELELRKREELHESGVPAGDGQGSGCRRKKRRDGGVNRVLMRAGLCTAKLLAASAICNS